MMKIVKLFPLIFLLFFLAIPVKVTYYGPIGKGPMAELAVINKLEFFGGLRILLLSYSRLTSSIFTPNSYVTFPYLTQNILISLFAAFIISLGVVMLIIIAKKAKII